MATPTVRDVAERANVDPSTVSRAFSNHPWVAEETRNRVLQAAKELGFVPNALARSLVTGKTRAVGLIVPDDVNPAYLEIAHAFASEAKKNGYELIVRLASLDEDGVLRAARLLLNGRVDGIVAIFAGRSDREANRLINAMKRARLPIVLLSESSKSGNCVIMDVAALFESLFVALLEDGLRRIAVPWTASWVKSGWKAALKQGAWGDADLVTEAIPNDLDASRRWVRGLAEQWPGEFAIATTDDMHMTTIARALNMEGLRFPGRVTLAGGLHPTFAAYFWHAPFWYVDYIPDEIARVGFGQVQALIENKESRTDITVVVRPRIRRLGWRDGAQP